jgi:hypothetical protein
MLRQSVNPEIAEHIIKNCPNTKVLSDKVKRMGKNKELRNRMINFLIKK